MRCEDADKYNDDDLTEVNYKLNDSLWSMMLEIEIWVIMIFMITTTTHDPLPLKTEYYSEILHQRLQPPKRNHLQRYELQ